MRSLPFAITFSCTLLVYTYGGSCAGDFSVVCFVVTGCTKRLDFLSSCQNKNIVTYIYMYICMEKEKSFCKYICTTRTLIGKRSGRTVEVAVWVYMRMGNHFVQRTQPEMNSFLDWQNMQIHPRMANSVKRLLGDQR